MAEAYPLQWPAGWPRSNGHERNYHFKMNDGDMVDHLYRELDRLGARNIVVSSNVVLRLDGRPAAKQNKLEDPGVAIYFTMKDREQCIPCDKWDSPIHNLHAVGLAIAAIRGFERWGTGQMVDAAFSGFTTLPETSTIPLGAARGAWYQILGVEPDSTPDVIRRAYREKARVVHPDNQATGDTMKFHELQNALAESGARTET